MRARDYAVITKSMHTDQQYDFSRPFGPRLISISFSFAFLSISIYNLRGLIKNVILSRPSAEGLAVIE